MLNQMYEQYCANRLPCGICRLTNMVCPKCGVTITTTTPTTTIDFSKVTCAPATDSIKPQVDITYSTTNDKLLDKTEATTTTSATYGVKGSTWASVNTKEEPK